MRSLPILFKGPMVRGIIDRRKTKSRRLVVVRPEHHGGAKRQQPHPAFTRAQVGDFAIDETTTRHFGVMFTAPNGADLFVKSPYGRPGDELWVREQFSYREHDREIIDDLDPLFWYWADGNQPDDSPRFYNFGPPKPSIHMPRPACRIRLQLETITVERLLPISVEEVRAEGVPENWGEADPEFFRCPGIRELEPHVWDNMTAEEQWIAVWDSINGKGSAAKRPWVWVLGFSILEAPDKVSR